MSRLLPDIESEGEGRVPYVLIRGAGARPPVAKLLPFFQVGFFGDDTMTNEEKTKTGRGKIVAGIVLVGVPALWALAAIVTAIAMEVPNNFSWEPEFNREVHSHIENAYYANTPELMVKELTAARDGMQGLGLDGWCDMRPWKQVASCSMAWQYDHVNSIITRAEAVKQDRDRQIKEGSSDQLADVYETKMDNLRAFIAEDGWSDEVARNAFYVEHHPFYAGFHDYSAVALLAFIATVVATVPLGIVLFIKGMPVTDRYFDENW